MNLPEKLERGLGLKEAIGLNMIDMVGIGPFIVIPIVIRDMQGPQCLLAWIAGAVLALFDGCVWAELGAAMPEAGGSYVFLREAYGALRWGRLLSFLFIWQILFQAPLVIASGAIGFAQYFTYLRPLGALGQRAVAGGVVILVVVVLYRRIATLGKISIALWAVAIGTILWLIWGGATHFNPKLAFSLPKHVWSGPWIFFAGLGAATVQTMYTYLGYYNVSNIGGEIREAERNIPRAIFFSILGIAALYLGMQVSILGVLPWQQAQHSVFIYSAFVAHLYGSRAAKVATVLILWIAFGSLFSATLGYSRIPYAAALDSNFFSIFARVHPTKRFPHVSLVALGATAFVISLLFGLEEVIKAILAMRILVQFIGQAIGLIRLRRRWPSERFPFKMWWFPLPVVISIVGWAAIFVSTGRGLMLAAIGFMIVGALLFLVRSRLAKEWPFAEMNG